MSDDCEKLSVGWNDASRTICIQAEGDREIVLTYHEASFLYAALESRGGRRGFVGHTDEEYRRLELAANTMANADDGYSENFRVQARAGLRAVIHEQHRDAPAATGEGSVSDDNG